MAGTVGKCRCSESGKEENDPAKFIRLTLHIKYTCCLVLLMQHVKKVLMGM